MSDPERRVVESSYRESPASRPSFAVEVLAPTLIFTGATWALFAVGAADTQLADRAAAVTCIVSLVVLLWLWHTEGRPVHVTEHTRYVDEPKPRERPFVPSPESINSVKVGKWDFTESEWLQLGKVLATGKVTRRKLEPLTAENGTDPLFSNINEIYGDILAELQRLGFIDENNETTDVARRHYSERGFPLPGLVS